MQEEREAKDKYSLCYCTLNLLKLEHQLPWSGGVLASFDEVPYLGQ